MKILRYEFNGCIKSFPWSARGEELAAKEAENGEYAVMDITEEEAAKMGFVVNKEPSTDDVINTLLGVAK